MAKTYAPQLARLLKRIVVYDSKHRSKYSSVVSATQLTDLTTIINAINNSWASVNTTELP